MLRRSFVPFGLLLTTLSVPWATGCLRCFISSVSMKELCDFYQLRGEGDNKKADYAGCIEKVYSVFREETLIEQVSVAATELHALNKAYTDAFDEMIDTVKKKNEKTDYDGLLKGSTQKLLGKLQQLSKAVPCVEPCGYQKEAVKFECYSCSIIECSLPLDCPMEMQVVKEKEKATLTCEVAFGIPEDITIRWKFVKDLKTIDLSFFREIYTGQDTELIVKKVNMFNQGSYLCEMYDEDEVFVRLYFYLEVENVDQGPDASYQKMFDTVINSNDIDDHHKAGGAGPTAFPSLNKMLQDQLIGNLRLKMLLVLGVMLLTILILLTVGFLYVWATDTD